MRLLTLTLFSAFIFNSCFAKVSYNYAFKYRIYMQKDNQKPNFSRKQRSSYYRLKTKKRSNTKPLLDPGARVALLIGSFFILIFGTFIFMGLASTMPVGLAALISYGSLFSLLLLTTLFISLADYLKRRRKKRAKKAQKDQPYSFE